MRAVTAPELAQMRKDNQWSAFYMAFADTPTVFAARVNQTFATVDGVTAVTFDTVTIGAYTDLQNGMTMLVGSAAGLSDIGACRVRSATSTVITIGKTSDIAWADNLYLTAIDDYMLWTKQPTISANAIQLDDDVTYTDQLVNCDPVPVMGPDALVRLSGASISYFPSGGASWVLGSTITDYSWACAGATVYLGTTDAPEIKFTTSGTYILSLTVTAANGKTTTGRRTIQVEGTGRTPITEFTLDNLSGNIEAGDWSASVTMYAQAGLSSVRDFAKVFLYADDYYGNTLGSIGQVSGLEAQLFVGRISGESIAYNAELGTVEFTIDGPAKWLDRLSAVATTLLNTDGTPDDWNTIPSMSLTRAAWYLLYWRSTFIETHDLIEPTQAAIIGEITAGMGSIWTQLSDISTNWLVSEPRCNRYGQLFILRDPQVMTTTERSALPTIMAITSNDIAGKVSFERRVTSNVSYLELTGLQQTTDAGMAVIMAQATGAGMKHYGKPQTKDRIAVVDQADANVIAGGLLAKANNNYPNLSLELAANNRMIDIAGAGWITLSITAASTPRGIVWTNQRLIIRRVEYRFDHVTGAVSTRADFEPEAVTELSVSMQPPAVGEINKPPEITIPVWRPFGMPIPSPDTTPITPPVDDTGACASDAPANGPFPIYVIGTTYSNNEGSAVRGWFDGSLRARGAGADHITTVVVNCIFEELTAGNWVRNNAATWGEAYLLNEFGVRLATGTWSGTGPQRTITFEPPANTVFNCIEFTAGLADYFTPSALTYALEVRNSGAPYPHTLRVDSMLWQAISGGIQINYTSEANFTTGGAYIYTFANMTVTGLPALTTYNMEVSARVMTTCNPNQQYQQMIGVFGTSTGDITVPLGTRFLNLYGVQTDATAQNSSSTDINDWPAGTDPAGYADHFAHYAVIDKPKLYKVRTNGAGEIYPQVWSQLAGTVTGSTYINSISAFTIRPEPTRRLTITSVLLYNVCSL